MVRMHLVLVLLIFAATATAWAAKAPPATPPAPTSAATPATAPAVTPSPTVALPSDSVPAAQDRLRSPVLDYLPNDADLVALIRFEQLVRTPLWKEFADPDVGLYQKLFQGFPSGIDFEKDVVAAAVSIETTPQEGRPDSAYVAFILEMNRDVQPADLLRGRLQPQRVTGLKMPVYPVASLGLLMAVPQPRIVVLASQDYIARVVGSAQEPKGLAAGAPPLDLLTVPGDITFAGRMPAGLREAIRTEYGHFQRSVLKPGMTGDQAMQFALYYNFARLAIETEGVSGSLYLTRAADALRADIHFGSKAMAPFVTAILQAMADPLQMMLPALMGGAPLDEPPADPFYRAVADGPVVHLTMSKTAAERFARSLFAATRVESGRTVSAAHLRQLGTAALAYYVQKGALPQTWSQLVEAGLVTDPALFENPALAVHLPTGDYDLVPLKKDSLGSTAWMKMLAYEANPKDAPPPPGVNVLFADGHVEYLAYDKFQQLYRQTLETLGH